MRFLDASATSAHAVEEAARMLDGLGFERLFERERWLGAPSRPFYVARGLGSLIAVVPGASPPWESGFRIVGAHTDYPGFRLKPSPVRMRGSSAMLGVEIYGSPIIATWFDRDLSLAGTAWFGGPGEAPEPRLWRMNRPVCRISMPAMHLNRGVNDEGFTFNKEENLCPMLGLSGVTADSLAEAIADACSERPDRLAGFAGHVVDCQPAAVGGLVGEMIFSGRIDNLAMAHAAVRSLAGLRNPASTAVACIFDNEEVGSSTFSGAASNFLDATLERICAAEGREGLFRAIPRSVMISADAAHAFNPCYEGRFDRENRPLLNAGPVVKVNSMQRYSTSPQTSAYFAECAKAVGVPVQSYVSRNDMPCGSTIGPIISSRLGIATVDAGDPTLSMHSVREAAGVEDHGMMISVLAAHMEGRIPF